MSFNLQHMKRMMILISSLVLFAACNDRLHGSGAVEPRSHDADTSAYLPSAKGEPLDRTIDSSKDKGKYREDIQERDTSKGM
jgi:hypothetical protein